MTCLSKNTNELQAADLLIGYLEGTLDQARRAELDLHAASCSDCRGLLGVQLALDDDLTDLEGSLGLDAQTFDQRLMARVAIEREQETSAAVPGILAAPPIREQAGGLAWLRRWFSRPLVPVAVAASVMLLVGFFAMRPGAGGGGAVAQPEAVGDTLVDDGNKQASVDPELEQLEQMLEDLELLMPLTADGSM